MFQRINDKFNIEVANFGAGNDRVLIFRLSGAGFDSTWEQIEGTRALLVGGIPARLEMKRLFDSSNDGLGRPALQGSIPGGVNGRSHTAMRKFLGL